MPDQAPGTPKGQATVSVGRGQEPMPSHAAPTKGAGSTPQDKGKGAKGKDVCKGKWEDQSKSSLKGGPGKDSVKGKPSAAGKTGGKAQNQEAEENAEPGTAGDDQETPNFKGKGKGATHDDGGSHGQTPGGRPMHAVTWVLCLLPTLKFLLGGKSKGKSETEKDANSGKGKMKAEGKGEQGWQTVPHDDGTEEGTQLSHVQLTQCPHLLVAILVFLKPLDNEHAHTPRLSLQA